MWEKLVLSLLPFPREPRHDAFVIPASLKLNPLDVPTKCWHADRPPLSSSDDAARANRAIAKIAGRVEEEAIRAPNWSPFGFDAAAHLSYRAISPRTSSKRSSSSFRGILAFIPRAFLASKLPRRLFISRCAEETDKKNDRRGGRGESCFLFAPSNVTSRSLSSFPRVFSKALS